MTWMCGVYNTNKVSGSLTWCLVFSHGVLCIFTLTLLSTGARGGKKIINLLNDWSAYSSLLILVTNKKVAVYLSRFDGPQKPMYFQVAKFWYHSNSSSESKIWFDLSKGGLKRWYVHKIDFFGSGVSCLTHKRIMIEETNRGKFGVGIVKLKPKVILFFKESLIDVNL